MEEELELYSEKELLMKLIEQQKKSEQRRKVLIAVLLVCTAVLAGVLIYCTISIRSDLAEVTGQMNKLNETIDQYKGLLDGIDLSKLDELDDLKEALKKLESVFDWLSGLGIIR